MSSKKVARPCTAADIVSVSSELKFSWGPPYGSFDDLPWESLGPALGFDPWGVVVTDQDWETIPSGEAVRYVLVHDGDQWVLRWGKTSPKVIQLHREAGNREEPFRARHAKSQLDTGLGTHRIMCSRGEAERSQTSGHLIRAGYITQVESGFVWVE